jgi:capsular polysaccharide biosynthesis protein
MLTTKPLQNVSLTPFIREDDRRPEPFALGAYDADLNFIDDFLLRRWGSAGRAPYDRSQAIRRVENGIYGGVILLHYGHFLLESLSRYWALKDAREDRPIIWHYQGQPDLNPWQREIFDLLGIDTGRFIYIDTLTELTNICLPEAAFVIGRRGHPWFFSSLCIAKPKNVVAGKKAWLSRSQLEKGRGRIVNEEELEAKLLEAGWKIFHPQMFSVVEQIEMLQDATLIAGFMGAAFHTMLFFNVKSQVVIFNRPGPGPWNYQMIAARKHISQVILHVDLEYVSGNGTFISSRLKDPDQIMQKLSTYA